MKETQGNHSDSDLTASKYSNYFEGVGQEN
jgi:hypothetical protein